MDVPNWEALGLHLFTAPVQVSFLCITPKINFSLSFFKKGILVHFYHTECAGTESGYVEMEGGEAAGLWHQHWLVPVWGLWHWIPCSPQKYTQVVISNLTSATWHFYNVDTVYS